MRTIALAVAFAVLDLGCGYPGGSAAAPPSGRAVPRCGGTRPGFDYVVAGYESAFFTARSSQRIAFAPGSKVELGPGKEPTTLTIAKDNGGVSIECACPAGCSASPGCVIVYEPGTPGAGAVCSGDCTSVDTCCSGCAFWSRWP